MGKRGGQEQWGGGEFHLAEVKARDVQAAQGILQPSPVQRLPSESKGPVSGGMPPRGRSKGKGPMGRSPTPSPARNEEPRSPRRGLEKGSCQRSFPSSLGKGGRGYPAPRENSPTRRPPYEGGYSPSQDRPCAACGGTDHWVRECPNKWCPDCKEKGHTLRECPKKGEAPPRGGTPPRRRSSA